MPVCVLQLTPNARVAEEADEPPVDIETHTQLKRLFQELIREFRCNSMDVLVGLLQIQQQLCIQTTTLHYNAYMQHWPYKPCRATVPLEMDWIGLN